MYGMNRRLRGAARCEASLRSEEHTSELQSHVNLVCRLLLEKKKPLVPAPIFIVFQTIPSTENLAHPTFVHPFATSLFHFLDACSVLLPHLHAIFAFAYSPSY